MSAKIRDLLWLINCARTMFMTTRDPPPPLWFQGDECMCAPRRDSRCGYALHGDPLAEHWSQAAWRSSPARLQGGGLEFRVWGSAGGMICQEDMYARTAGFDPVWTHLHNAFCSISHTTLFILHDVDTHNPNQSKERSAAGLFTACKVLNMVLACIVWT